MNAVGFKKLMDNAGKLKEERAKTEKNDKEE